jgi:hypothetical protein
VWARRWRPHATQKTKDSGPGRVAPLPRPLAKLRAPGKMTTNCHSYFTAKHVSLEDQIFEMWERAIETAQSYDSIPAEPVRTLVRQCKDMMRDHGRPDDYITMFFHHLATALEAGTNGHATTKLIVLILKEEVRAAEC